jgi:exopolyphosphatase/guanosine-5'-triphosphate,3'-diphosphate pyrophosphatase
MADLKQLQNNTIELMIRKYENEPSHARQVTRLALIIFDKLKGSLHNYSENERNYLEYASLIHDIGYYISPDKHNKNAYKIIIKEDMPGFVPEEKEIIANIARYHRGSPPKKKHKNFSEISNKEQKELIKALSAIIRIADGLDRSHTDAICDIDVMIDKYTGKITFIVYSRSINCPAEIYGANKKKDLFEDYFNLHADFIIKHK